jgi:hypothetical protein
MNDKVENIGGEVVVACFEGLPESRLSAHGTKFEVVPETLLTELMVYVTRKGFYGRSEKLLNR